MGSDQSRPKSGDDAAGDKGQTVKLDYYELLGVSEDATEDEIKLKHHPDKNPDNVEEATKFFADLQQAYEERAFYDRHKNEPIATTDNDLFDHVSKGQAAPPASKRKPGEVGVTLAQLMRFFDPKLARKMDDSTEGFFSIYRSLFDLLASDEQLHYETNNEGRALNPPIYPSFGNSDTPYAPPSGATRKERDAGVWLRDFYTVWGEFATEKRFDWLSAWDADRGPDRRVRRLMEKENKKLRDDHRKEYNDTVRSLVTFVQHRDPRFHAYQRQRTRSAAKTNGKNSVRSQMGPAAGQNRTGQKPESTNVHAQIAAERQRERMRAAENFQEQSWQQIDEDDLEFDYDDLYVSAKPKYNKTPKAEDNDGEDECEGEERQGGSQQDSDDDGEDEEVEQEPQGYECFACNKTFQSEKAWENHERSKKHKQAVWRLRKQMLAEDADFGFDEADTGMTTGYTTPYDVPDDGTAGLQTHLDTIDLGDGEHVANDILRDKKDCMSTEESDGGSALPTDDIKSEIDGESEVEAEDEVVHRSAKPSPINGKTYGMGQEKETDASDEDRDSDHESHRDGKSQHGGSSSTAAPGLTKREKRRQKEKNKKLEEAKAKASDGIHRCNVCEEEYTSKSKLFDHVRREGHMLAEPIKQKSQQPDRGQSGGKKKGKRK